MALSLALRRPNALQALLKCNKLILANNKSLTQLVQSTNTKLSLSKNLVQYVSKRNMSADHSKLWPIEKAFSIGLLALVPATFIAPNAVCDNLFAVATVLHFHWGLEACVVDYIRPIIFGPAIPKLAMGLLYLLSAATLGGLVYYNMNSIGIGATGRKLWAIKE